MSCVYIKILKHTAFREFEMKTPAYLTKSETDQCICHKSQIPEIVK